MTRAGQGRYAWRALLRAGCCGKGRRDGENPLRLAGVAVQEDQVQLSSPAQEVGGTLHERVAEVGAHAEWDEHQVGPAQELLREGAEEARRKVGSRLGGRRRETSLEQAAQCWPGNEGARRAQHSRNAPLSSTPQPLVAAGRTAPCSSPRAAAAARPRWRQRGGWTCGRAPRRTPRRTCAAGGSRRASSQTGGVP